MILFYIVACYITTYILQLGHKKYWGEEGLGPKIISELYQL